MGRGGVGAGWCGDGGSKKGSRDRGGDHDRKEKSVFKDRELSADEVECDVYEVGQGVEERGVVSKEVEDSRSSRPSPVPPSSVGLCLRTLSSLDGKTGTGR